MLVGICTPEGSVAQQRIEPFESIELRFSGMSNVNRNFLHEFWKPGVGGELSAATPFYLGFAEFGGALHQYRVEEPSVPRFSAVHLYFGWGLGTDLGSRLRIEGSGRVGNYRMTFDENTFPGVKNENELTVGFQGRLAVRAAGPVSIHVAGNYTKAFTYIRLNLWYVAAGISYQLDSPGWLKEFLR